jgi:predicted dehydrogenase
MSTDGAKVLGIGVIGCGHWGVNHIRNFRAAEGSAVVRCADPIGVCRVRAGKLFPGLPCDADHRAVLDDPSVDAVVIAAPTALHYNLARQALDAGKHVLCEKPLTTVGAEARDLVRRAAAGGRTLMVGHVFMFNSGVRYMRDAVQQGTLGRIFCLRAARTNLGPVRSDVNAAWDLATHDISIFNHLLGRRPMAVSATGSAYLQPKVQDVVFLTLDYGEGVLAAITASWLDPRKVRQISLVGSEKMITWDDMALSGSIRVYDRRIVQDPVYDSFEQFRLLTHEGDVTIPRLPGGEPLAAEAACFLAACRGGHLDRCTGIDGAEVVEVLEAVDRSLAAGGGRVEVRYGA